MSLTIVASWRTRSQSRLGRKETTRVPIRTSISSSNSQLLIDEVPPIIFPLRNNLLLKLRRPTQFKHPSCHKYLVESSIITPSTWQSSTHIVNNSKNQGRHVVWILSARDYDIRIVTSVFWSKNIQRSLCRSCFLVVALLREKTIVPSSLMLHK